MKSLVILALILANFNLCGPVFGGDVENFLSSRRVVQQIFFPKRGSLLTESQKETLNECAAALKNSNTDNSLLRVEGFASSDGQAVFNFDLSVRRAVAVQSYLQQQGVRTELFLTGYGEKTGTTAKLSEQRRVDIVIYQQNRTVEQLFQGAGQVERFVIQ